MAAAVIWALAAFSLGRLGQPSGAPAPHAPCAACPKAGAAKGLQSTGG